VQVDLGVACELARAPEIRQRLLRPLLVIEHPAHAVEHGGAVGRLRQRVRDQRMRFVVIARAVRERIAERVLDDRVARSLLEQLSKLADGRVDTVGTFQEENARHPEVDRIRVALDSSVEFRERTTLFVALGKQRGALHDHVNSQLRARARELVEMQQAGLNAVEAARLRLDEVRARKPE